MSDWRDVMEAREAAKRAQDLVARREDAETNGSPPHGNADLLLCTLAICREIRALAVLIDYARGDAR